MEEMRDRSAGEEIYRKMERETERMTGNEYKRKQRSKPRLTGLDRVDWIGLQTNTMGCNKGAKPLEEKPKKHAYRRRILTRSSE